MDVVEDEETDSTERKISTNKDIYDYDDEYYYEDEIPTSTIDRITPTVTSTTVSTTTTATTTATTTTTTTTSKPTTTTSKPNPDFSEVFKPEMGLTSLFDIDSFGETLPSRNSPTDRFDDDDDDEDDQSVEPATEKKKASVSAKGKTITTPFKKVRFTTISPKKTTSKPEIKVPTAENEPKEVQLNIKISTVAKI